MIGSLRGSTCHLDLDRDRLPMHTPTNTYLKLPTCCVHSHRSGWWLRSVVAIHTVEVGGCGWWLRLVVAICVIPATYRYLPTDTYPYLPTYLLRPFAPQRSGWWLRLVVAVGGRDWCYTCCVHSHRRVLRFAGGCDRWLRFAVAAAVAATTTTTTQERQRQRW